MRVITGTARGMRLKTLTGNDVRPTIARVKEAVFSMIQFEIEGSAVLDLFCGSGQMGLEALSRGAASCNFVDAAQASAQITKENLKAARLYDRANVAVMDAQAFLQSSKSVFDIAFLDPPYHRGLIDEMLPVLAGKMSASGVILCETAADETLPDQVGRFVKVKHNRYGTVAVHVYRIEETQVEG